MKKNTLAILPDNRELRIFGLMVGSIFLIIGAWPVFFKLPPRFWALAFAFLLITPGLLYPRLLRIPHLIWGKIGAALGWFNTRLILTLLYFSAVLPVAVVLKLSGKTPLQLHYAPELDSYREKPDDPDSNINEQF